jgi:hypothetical protein
MGHSRRFLLLRATSGYPPTLNGTNQDVLLSGREALLQRVKRAPDF